MDFAAIIREAWAQTRRHRSLWVLGFFAGTSLGSCGNFSNLPNRASRPNRDSSFGQDGDGGDAFDQVGDAWGDLGGWIADHPGLVLTAVLAFVAVSLVFAVISLIAQGGMARATVDLAEGRPTSLGAAWAAGRRLFWRYVRLAILLSLFFLLVFLLAVGGGAAVAVGGVSGGLITLVVLLGLAIFLLFIPLGIVVAFAQRALAVEGVGARASLRAGWEILRANIGPSLLAWLVLIAVTLAATVGIGIALLVAAIPLFFLGVFAYAAGGGVTLAIYATVVMLAAGSALVVLLAAGNTFTWHFWTLVYLRARDRLLAAPAP